MKNTILFILTLLITACSGSSYIPAEDPNVSLAIAQAKLTSTSQAMDIQIINWTVTAQSWTPTPSLTPVPTSTPSITPTPTADATQTLVMANVNAELTKVVLGTERESNTNKARAWFPYFIAVLVVCLTGFLGFVGVKRLSYLTVQKDDKGDAPLVLNVVKNRVTDSDKNPNFESGSPDMKDILWNAFQQWLEKNHGIQPVQPRITSERQDIVTARDQQTDQKARTKVTTAALDKFMKEHALNAPVPMPTAITASVVSENDINMPLPPWDFIKQWDGTSKPLGFGKTGLITAKAASPHILISGKTGSGKTVYMMRTLTAASLAKGSQVVNIGYSTAGYGVFERHVNFHNVQLPDPRYVIACLAQVYDELKERKALIGGDMVEWEYWPGGQPPRPFLDVMLDELGNMAEDIYKDYDDGTKLTKELWSYISRIANEGRKVGIRFVAALQDPTSKSMDLRFRRNCTLVAFRQGDMDQSRAFLGTSGAEQLSVGHFMASLDSLVIGGGFSPTDAEILNYLAKSPVRTMEKPKWIEGVTRSVGGNQLETEEPPLQIIEPTATEVLPVKRVDEIAEMAERIRSQWISGMSGRQVAKLLGLSQYGGSLKTKTDKVIEYLTATTQTATTTEKQPEMGSFASEMA